MTERAEYFKKTLDSILWYRVYDAFMKTKKSPFLKIGELAKEAGVNLQPVYYYERRGILAASARLESGYRLYDSGALKKLRFIKSAQALGFSLAEISSLLKLRVGRTARCGSMLKKAEAKLREVDAKIESLDRLRRTLRTLISDCRRRNTTDACPILSSLEEKK